MIASVRKETEEKIELARIDLIKFLDKETKPIIERACTRLNEAFSVNLSFPQPMLESENMELVKPRVRSQTRYVDQGYGERVVKKRTFWHWLWVVPVEATEMFKRPDKREDYYTVSLEELIPQINQSIETSINSINKEINKYLNEDFQQ